MPQINDAMFAYFRAAGYTGALPDMRYAWLQDMGYASMRAAMLANGFGVGAISDFMFAFFSNLTTAFIKPGDTAVQPLLSDRRAHFRDINGVEPVSGPDEPVALVLDGANGLTLTGPAFGAELVTNGDFSDGLTGWASGSDGIISTSNEQLSVEVASGDTLGNANQALSLESGQLYRYSIQKVSQDANSAWGFSSIGPFASRFETLDNTATDTVVGFFVAPADTVYIQLWAQSTPGNVTVYDNVSVRRVIPFSERVSGLGDNVWDESDVRFDGSSEEVSTGVYRIFEPTGALTSVRSDVVSPLTVGDWYVAEFTIDSVTTITGGLTLTNTASSGVGGLIDQSRVVAGSKVTHIFSPDTEALVLKRAGGSGIDIQISNFTVRRIPILPAYQSDSTKRLTSINYPAGGITNLLDETDNLLDSGPWTDTSGAVTTREGNFANIAAKMYRITGDTVNVFSRSQLIGLQNVVETGQSYTYSVVVKEGTATSIRVGIFENSGAGWQGYVDFDWVAGEPSTTASVGASSINYEDLGDGEYRVSFVFTASGTISDLHYHLHPDRDANGDYTFFGAPCLNKGSTLRPYQNVADNGNNITETGVRTIETAAPDGIDDYLQTPNIDLSGGDEVTMAAGMMPRELPTVGFDAVANMGNPRISLVQASGTYSFSAGGDTGTVRSAGGDVGVVNEPNYIIGRAKVSTDFLDIKMKGGTNSNSANQGTGNLNSAPLYIGRNQLAENSFFEGPVPFVFLVDKVLSDAQRDQLASLAAYETGATT